MVGGRRNHRLPPILAGAVLCRPSAGNEGHKGVADFFRPAERGVQHASLRAANRRAVLTAIAFNQGISNAEVSRRTGLAPQTASAIVGELEQEGFIARGEVLRGRRGQPATPLYIDSSGAYGIGVEISWHHINIVLSNVGSEEIARYRRDYAYPNAETVVAEAAKAIAELVEKIEPGKRSRLAGIGLASPSNISRHIVAYGGSPEQVKLWSHFDLRGELERATGMAVSWFNDGNAACFAQMLMLPPPRPANMMYLFVSGFLGAGITAQNTLWEGPTGNAANIGAMLVTSEEGVRRQAFEIASTAALRTRLDKAGMVGPSSDPLHWSDWEPQLTGWVDAAGRAMAEIAFNTGAVLDVDHIIIDGEIPLAIIDRLVKATGLQLKELSALRQINAKVSAGSLGWRAGSLGAAQLQLFHRHFSREIGDMLGDQN